MIDFSINKDITIAKSLHSDFYTKEKYFDLSLSKILSKSWQLACHKSNLLKDNIYPFTFLENTINEPMVITKSDDRISSFTNVCTHRGHIINQKKCFRKRMKCDYHGRTFNLDGTMNSMPGFENVRNFPSDRDNIKSFPIIDWNDFIFTSLNPSININDILKDITDRVKNFPFEKISFSEKYSKVYNLDANWALYCENYLEGLHVPFVHKGLNNEIDLKTYKTKLLKNGVLQYTDNKNSEIYAYYYWIFPNLMFNFYDWGLSVNIVEPISSNKTRIKFLSFITKDSEQLNKKIKELDIVELEDEKVVLNVQKGVQSQFYKNGRYSAEYEKGTHHFHRLICQYIK
ncbi:MAG: choline monooxygenase [Candidatus Marinimicrobia bacterium]|nr:choline monooxygenase [Candidatus Neomarinimicrobiota bacterium]